MSELQVTEFKGLRTDKGQKFAGPENFYDISNFNYDDIVGANKILAPEVVYNASTTHTINGGTEYRYLDSNNVLQYEDIVCYGGSIYKNAINGTAVAIATGKTAATYDFCVLNDRLFMFNGKDYPLIYDGTVVWEMGAPKATSGPAAGVLTGTYYYACVFVTAGGDEYLGTVSNTVSPLAQSVVLDVPIGYSGVTQRKLYRTEAGGSTLKLLATIGNNTDLTYTDNIADGSLTTTIGPVNNPLPKAYFGNVLSNRLIMSRSDEYPTQIWVAGAAIELVDFANFVDVSNYGDDSTAIEGVSEDYNLLIVGTSKNQYTVQLSDTATTVNPTRSNVGVLSGYTMAKVPSNGDFPGGVMFLSTLGDVRLLNGNFEQPVATSLDNIRTENWSQPIKPTLDSAIIGQSNFYAIFFDYKYHLLVGSTFFVLDIRTIQWTTYSIRTESYSPDYSTMWVVNQNLYVGQTGASIIEKFYSSLTYRSEPLSCFLQSPQILASDRVKYIRQIYLYFVASDAVEINLRVICESNTRQPVDAIIKFSGGAFSSQDFNSYFFETSDNNEDYRVVYINRMARWVQFEISSTDYIFFRGYKIEWDELNNKESLLRM